MQDDRIPERIIERPVIVEPRRRSGLGILLGILLVAVAAIAVYFIATENQHRNREAAAIAGAAKSVGHAADQIGDAARDAVQDAQTGNSQ